MKSIKKTAEYTIYQKRNNRYAVKSANGQWLNGDDKVTVLVAESLIKLSAAAPVEAPAEEVPAAEEAPAEETKED